jgi:molybdopterin/thiamine biosynthesis adenylyltransferase
MERNTRFKDAPWILKEDIQVVIGGAGGISSWTALFLSRALEKKVQLFIYDFDKIEIQNLGGQFFKDSQIKKFKVDSLKENIQEYSVNHITAMKEKYDSNSLRTYYNIAGFDNMTARYDMFTNWMSVCEEDTGSLITPLFIDGRLLAEQIQIFCVTPENKEDYKRFLYKENEVEDASCTFKQTTHIAAIMGGLITTFFLNHIANCYEKNCSRAVPFQYQYLLPINLMEMV